MRIHGATVALALDSAGRLPRNSSALRA